ncbi:PepSY domain-containing protein [Teichococcus oryzae]|nr:PepSY domain-containing protein [Pseudoroseomonas oryzae]
MRTKTTALALAASLLAAPFALAQNQPAQQPSGTAGSPTAPRGGGTTMQQGTPGPTTGGTTAPGATSGTTSGDSGSTTGGAAAPGTNNPPTTTTPAAGANSFTEGQARSRIEAAGYTDVQELRKDEQGVWRGRAMRNGQQADVGLDFQGQVVTGSGTPR